MFFKQQITADCDYMQTLGNFLCIKMLSRELVSVLLRVDKDISSVYTYLFVDCIFGSRRSMLKHNNPI